MQIFFGVADDEEDIGHYNSKNAFGDPVNYVYGVEYGSNADGLDAAVIYDSSDRTLPVDIDAIPELILALEEVLVWQKKADEAIKLLDTIQDANFEIIPGSKKSA